MFFLKKLVFSTVFVLYLVFAGSASATIENSFNDLTHHGAASEIEYLYSKGVIKGYQDGTFRPNNSVTRVQAITMTARALNLNLNNRPNPGFKDIPVDHYAYREIAAAVAEGIYPKSDHLYPNAAISRESMARMIVSAFKLKGESQNVFKDVPKSYWAYPYITKLSANNITTGYTDNTFKPKNKLTRAQFSMFLARSMSNDFKTYTYTNTRLKYSIQLPNFTKGKIIIKDENVTTPFSNLPFRSTAFYYNDTSFAREPVLLLPLIEFPANKWDSSYEEVGFLSSITKRDNYVYVLENIAEHPYQLYYGDDYLVSPEANEFTSIYIKLNNALKAAKFY
jgi:hypothetical protein